MTVNAKGLGYRELDRLGAFLIEATTNQNIIDLLNNFEEPIITYDLHRDEVLIETPLATFYPEDCE